MKFTHHLPVESPAFIILSLGGLDYVYLCGGNIQNHKSVRGDIVSVICVHNANLYLMVKKWKLSISLSC